MNATNTTQLSSTSRKPMMLAITPALLCASALVASCLAPASAWAQAAGAPRQVENHSGTAATAPRLDATLNTPECQRARTALEAAFAASAKDREANAARLEQARKSTETACLGGNNAPAAKERYAPDPPIAAPAIRATPAPAPIGSLTRLPPVTVAPPAPVAIPQPQVLSTCDATGCFDTNGTRLNQSGTMLSGPRGVCSTQGAFANCP